MTKPDRAVWLDVLSHLRAKHPQICRQWFDEIEPIALDAGVFKVRVDQEIRQKYLARECGAAFTEALQAVTGALVAVRFVSGEEEAEQRALAAHEHGHDHTQGGAHGVDASVHAGHGGHSGSSRGAHHTLHNNGLGVGGASNNASGANHSVSHAGHQGHGGRSGGVPAQHTRGGLRQEGLIISPDYTFENFIVGPENRLAHAAAHAVTDKPGRAYNPLFVHGGVGLGKTHLLQAICLRLLAARPKPAIYYVSCEEFMTQFMAAVQAGEMDQFRHRFRDVDMLVIDDIHFLTKRERTQEEFFHTFNALYQSGKQIVLSSDAAPADIPDLEARLVSRFQCGLVVQMQPPCFETRVQIVKQKGRIRGLEIPEDVALYIAGRALQNIRELEGAVTKVQMVHVADGRPVDIELAKAALEPDSGSLRPQVTMTTIVETVCNHYGVKLTDLQSKRRQKSIVLPRQICMYLARRYTRFSLEEIGGHFGGRDHTTVMHAVRTIESDRDGDQEFARVVQALEDQIRTPPPPRKLAAVG
jgi:chromosomal replication initiator protein